MKTEITKRIGNKQGLTGDLFDVLMEKRYTVKELQTLNEAFTYKTINHWSDKGYLLTESGEGEWRKFSFTEYIWMLFLNEIRELNVSHKDILSTLFMDWGLSPQKEDELGEDKIQKLKHSDFEKILKAIDKNNVIEFFCLLLIAIISYKTPISLRLFKNASTLTIYGNPAYHGFALKSALDSYKHRLEESNFMSSVTISIDGLIKEYIIKKDLDNIAAVNLLTKEEIEILEQVRNGELKEITIFMEDGRPVRIELVEETDRVDAARRIKEDFFTDYQSCEYVTNGGKTIARRRKTRKRLS